MLKKALCTEAAKKTSAIKMLLPWQQSKGIDR